MSGIVTPANKAIAGLVGQTTKSFTRYPATLTTTVTGESDKFTWTKPNGTIGVYVECIGGGAGGGGGCRGSEGSGGGGGGGAFAFMFFGGDGIPATLECFVGNHGSGGAGATSATSNGSDGSRGKPSWVVDPNPPDAGEGGGGNYAESNGKVVLYAGGGGGGSPGRHSSSSSDSRGAGGAGGGTAFNSGDVGDNFDPGEGGMNTEMFYGNGQNASGNTGGNGGGPVEQSGNAGLSLDNRGAKGHNANSGNVDGETDKAMAEYGGGGGGHGTGNGGYGDSGRHAGGSIYGAPGGGGAGMAGYGDGGYGGAWGSYLQGHTQGNQSPDYNATGDFVGGGIRTGAGNAAYPGKTRGFGCGDGGGGGTQRADGGNGGIPGAGGGAGGGMGGLIGNRATANLLTRTTGALAAAFFVTSITLAILAGGSRAPTSILEVDSPAPAAEEAVEPVGPKVPEGN